MKKIPEFLIDATNVYRTSEYIVKQKIGVRFDKRENNVVYSDDTYYRRTLRRDYEYEQAFKGRKNINGRRLPTTMYARTYID